MKRYLLFYGDGYYPCGGWNDFHGDFDSLDDAIATAETGNTPMNPKFDWAHIVDTTQHETSMPHTWMRVGRYWSGT